MFRNQKGGKQMPQDLNPDETLELARDIFKMKAELREAEQHLTTNLVRNEMQEFFSVNWRKLYKVTRR